MNQSSTPELNSSYVSQAAATPPQTSADDKSQLKGVLAEARNTRDVLVGFRSAVESGTYAGVHMMDVAKGMAFLEAILKQNNAHIHNLQERLDK